MIDHRSAFACNLRRLALAFVAAGLLSMVAAAQSAVPDLGVNANTLTQARAAAQGASGGARPVHVVKVWEFDDARNGNYDTRTITGQFPENGVQLTDGYAMHVTVQGPIGEESSEGTAEATTRCTPWIIAAVIEFIVILVLIIKLVRKP